MPGVVDFVTAADIPEGGVNYWMGPWAAMLDPQGAKLDTDKVFFTIGDTVPFIGAQLGLIVADTWAHARAAAKKVEQSYAQIAQPVATVEQAKQQGHVASIAHLGGTPVPEAAQQRLRLCHEMPEFSTERAEPAEGSKSLQGTFVTLAQNHMHLETKSATVIPSEGKLDIYCSGQYRDLECSSVGMVLNMPRNTINAHNIRIGGGFGAKCFWAMPTLCAVAVAANKLNRAIRLQNERSDDMAMNGPRNPFTYHYEASYDPSTGKLDTLNGTCECEVGWIPGVGAIIAGSGVSEIDNCFKWNSISLAPNIVLTNKPQHTFVRAPGTMQAACASAAIIDHVARSLGKDTDQVWHDNLYQVGDVTPAKVTIGSSTYNWTVPALWEQIVKDSNYEQRKKDVEAYNAANKWTKKGIAIATSKWNMAGISFYNTGTSIAIYGDGTVHIGCTGVEMGQGLNTKAILVAANIFGISETMISAEGSDTFTFANAGMTGGSGTSESQVASLIKAATVLKERLKPFTDKYPWVQAINMAAQAGISTNVTDWWSGTAAQAGGMPVPAYATYGVAVTEVMLDVLTGEVRCERADVLLDIGNQMDAAVDFGQAQGAFVMLLGYLFSEQMIWDKDAKQLNLGTWEYKIPTAYDIPIEFNMALLKNTPNPTPIAKSSKAVAEPVMSLISSPYLAVKNAIYAARKEVGHGDSWYQLDLPLTVEAVRTAVDVPANQMVVP